LYWDSTFNRLGIGTTTPSASGYSLTVFSQNTQPSNSSDKRHEALNVRGGDLLYGGQSPAISLKGYTWFGKNDGSVGIGASHSTVGTFDASSTFFTFQGYNENVTSYNPICLTAGYSPQIYLNTNGNVGINTATPAYKLDVLGTGNFTEIKTSNISSNTANVAINDAKFTSTSNAEYASFESDYNNNIYSRSSGGYTTYYANDGSFIEWSNEDEFWILYEEGYTVLVVDYFSNYGILNPTYFNVDGLSELLINGDASDKPLLRVGSLEFQPYALNNAWIGENVYYDGSGFIRRQTGSAGLFYFQGSEGQFRFADTASVGTSVSSNPVWKITYDGTMAVGSGMSFTNNSFTNAKFIVNSSGNVGIGTVTPSSKLYVAGNITCDNIIPTNPASITMRIGSESAYVDLIDNTYIYGEGEVVLRYSIGNNGLVKIVDVDSNTAALTVSNNNIGIGTTSPSGKLDVNGNVNIDGNLTFDSFTESVISNGNSGTSKTLSLASGTVHTCTLTGNCTFTMPTATAGKSFSMFLNSGSGNYTASFSGVRWADSASPTITILANKVDLFSFISDGSYWYGSFSQNYG
jgi:hypothetical protein